MRTGATFNGTVDNTVEQLGVFVRILPGLNGLVKTASLPGGLPSAYERGTPLRVQIVAIKQDRRRPDKANIELILV